jgi:diguanylate cyclase (GGDEF)-like protein
MTTKEIVSRPVPAASADGSDTLQGRSPFGDLSQATVMTIDDEPIMTDLIGAYLADAGYAKVISVNTSTTALDDIRREQPSLLLLDLMMPGVSGFDILRAVRRDLELRFLPVIVLTAANDPATKLKALGYGATDFLAKPVDASELALRVRNSLAFKAYQDRLANIDAVTGLPNRNLMLRRIAGVLQQSQRAGTVFALLQIELDRFKEINDTFGAGVSDELLRSIGQRLDSCIREGDMVSRLSDRDASTLARVGGHEFTVLLPMLPTAAAAENASRRLLAEMAKPFTVAGHEIVVTASIGIASFPGDGKTADALLTHAGTAMSQAKDLGGNQFAFYSADLNAYSQKRVTLGAQLRRALARDEFRLHFQPKVSIASGRITGAEALVRWQHPDLGLLSPDRFIPLAQELGLIADIGTWVLQQACAQCRAWEMSGVTGLHVSVNVAQPQLRQGAIVTALTEALRAFPLSSTRLVLELTESMLIDSSNGVRNTLADLRAMGALISIDDFGTGYSSLSYLKRFPVDEIKIDKSFVAELPENQADVAIIKAVVTLAHSMGMSVVGEGVETAAQLAALADLGCDEYQGYLCSRPVPPDEYAAILCRLPGGR